MPLTDIPVIMYGMQVGTVDIDDEGGLTVHVETPCQFAIDWISEFAGGQHNAMQIAPFMIGQGAPPTPPVPVE